MTNEKKHGFRVWILPVMAAIVLGFIVLSLSIIIAWPALSNAMAKARDKTILTLRLQVADLTNSILAYTTEHDGVTPDHASLLIPVSPMSPAASWAPEPFIAVGSLTDPENVSIGTTTLDLFMSLARADQIREAQLAADRLPAAAVAHRLGDFVFTQIKLDDRTDSSRLWLVIFCHNPRMKGLDNAVEMTVVGRADGIVEEFPTTALAKKLAQQNSLRRQLGLQPLPDPRVIDPADPPMPGKRSKG